MKLRGTEFGNVFNAAGARGFFGEGYWYHPYAKPFGLDWTGSTLAAKTVTIGSRRGLGFGEPGNLRLSEDGITLLDRFPDCIKASVLKGATLNAVGLGGPGLQSLLERGAWQRIQEQFLLSFMPVGTTAGERRDEVAEAVRLLVWHMHNFRARVALTLNCSCPNVQLDLRGLMEEYGTWLGLASALGIPLLVKYNVLMPVAYGCQVASGKECDGIIISNTYPWNSLPGEVRRKYFGSTVSPLDKYGGGGLSAPWLRPFVLRWITEARALGFTKPIIACGAIHHWKHAKEYLDAGADAVKIGSVAMVRPWCVAGIIRFVNDYCKRREG